MRKVFVDTIILLILKSVSVSKNIIGFFDTNTQDSSSTRLFTPNASGAFSFLYAYYFAFLASRRRLFSEFSEIF
jgi:hypothetical protein